VFPSKPNLGSTTVATNLALRAQGEGCGSVLLADLDPLYGSVGFHLKIKSSYTFLDAFSNWAKMDQELWNKLVVKRAGLDVLIAPEASGACDFEAPNAIDFLHIVRKSYSHAFLDCPGLITPWYTQLAAEADEVILVTTNELAALHAAKQSLRILEASGVDAPKIKVLVNRYDPVKGLPSEAIETALRTRVFHTLPNDYNAVQKAIFDGRPIGSSSQLGKGLDELWTRLMNRTPIAKTARSWSSIFSLVKRQPRAPGFAEHS
jgi:Flp pilus assembly CpaE family ATPase